MKRKVLLFAIIIVLVVQCFQASALTDTTVIDEVLNEKILVSELFSADAVKTALLDSKKSSETVNILKEVTQLASMDISVPRINPDKIIQKNEKLICELTEYETFYDELIKHGISKNEIPNMTLAEYRALESSWTMSADHVAILKRLYPELENSNMSKWTIGDQEAYVKEKNKQMIINRFTDAQLSELNQRGILIDDAFLLFKEYHTVDAILNQTDATLKDTLEKAYISMIEITLGEGAYNDIRSARVSDKSTSANMPRYSIPSSAAPYYEWVTYPKYGSDYFSLDASTTAYWISLRSERVFITQGLLYAAIQDDDGDLYCSNLYGTYSVSQGGAHEGIDFARDTNRIVYSPVVGVRVTGGLYHQQAIYDANHPDGPKTYSFLHMTNLATDNSFSLVQPIGRQGMEGNATGYHVHFEVHSGRTTALSSTGANHTLQSLSPYRLTEYYE